MKQDVHIYAVIIGSEILNGRRRDRHFDYLQKALAQRGYTLYSCEIIKDDKALIASSYKRVRADENAVMFSFGGIGSTPDDLTREVASAVFTQEPTLRHPQFEKDIIERFAEKAYPNRILMADLPKEAGLLKNPVNNMSGFYLEDRLFFVPGFPEMAHPMVDEAIARFLPQNATLYRKGFVAKCSEERFIGLMQALPTEIECSALPMFVDKKPQVEISLAAYHFETLERHYDAFLEFLNKEKISYSESTL